MATRGTGGSITAAASQQRDATRLDRIAAYVVGADGAEPDRAAANLADARAEGFDALLAEHRRAWSRRWERADVRIEGDVELQLEVRLALFHLMASVADRGRGGRRCAWDHGARVSRTRVLGRGSLRASLPRRDRTRSRAGDARIPVAIACRPRSPPRVPRDIKARASRGNRRPPVSMSRPHSGRDQSGHVTPIRTGEAEVHIVGDVAWAAVLLHRLDRRPRVRRRSRPAASHRDGALLGFAHSSRRLRASAHLRCDRARRVSRTGRRQRVHQRARALEPPPRGRGRHERSTTARSTPRSSRSGTVSPTRSSTDSTRQPASTRSSPASSISNRR